MICTMLKSSHINEETKSLNKRVLKTFSYKNFKGGVRNTLGSSSDLLEELDHIFTTKLNKHAAKKEKLIRGNSKPHTNRN